MRIALLVDPPAYPVDASAWIQDVVRETAVSLVMLPAEDPLVRAIDRAFRTDESREESGVILLARAASGSIDEDYWEKLGFGASARVLEPSDEAAVESAIAEASNHFDQGDLEKARRAYTEADSLLARDNGPRRAEVLVCLANIESKLGAQHEAEKLLDRAIAIFPEHLAALRQRIELARASSDAATAAALRRRLLRLARTDEERAQLLSSIADESLVATTEALEQALALRPRDPRLLERLQAVMEAAGRWKEAVDAKVALSETIEKPYDRARSLAAAAGMCARRTNDVARAVALYEAAIADDPTTPGAFEAIEAVLVKSDDWAGVERAYSRQLERLSGRRESEAESMLLERLARVRAENLGDMRGAMKALDRLVELKPQNVEPRAKLAALLEKSGEVPLAIRCLENAAVVAPTRVATFRDLFRLSSQIGDVDRGYCACAVLVHMGEAEDFEQRVFREFVPETTQRPRAPLDTHGWSELFIPEYEHAVSRIVYAIAPAAIELRLDQWRAAKKLPDLKKSDRQDVEKSTVSAVRTVGWAASVLGIPVPDVYVRNEEIPTGVASLPLPDPTLVIGKSLLTGRSIPELAFAIARELACQSLTARLVTFYPTLPELKTLLLASVALALPMSLGRDAVSLRDSLGQKLDPGRRAEVESAVGALHARDGRLDINAWIRAIEIASCRGGLLVSGDITSAARMLAIDGRVISGLSAADRIRDLIPFSVSERYGKVRRALGVDAVQAKPESIR